MQHPKQVLKEQGIDFHQKKVEVYEITDENVYLVLPPKPGHLSEEDLQDLNAADGPCYADSTVISSSSM